MDGQTSVTTRSNLKQAGRRWLKTSRVGEHILSVARRKPSYSQFGEDVCIDAYYGRLAFERNIVVERACIVDIGAFSPILCSNSYYFYKRGWHGINIDPTPCSKRHFDRVRPRDTNLELGIAPENGTSTFFQFDTPSVWNTLDAASAAHASEVTGISPREVKVTLARLETVLDEHLNGRTLEVLLIDAEGYDIEILHSNDFSRHRPRVIMIEVMDVSVTTLATSPVVEYLSGFGYKLQSWINPNLMLVREDSLLSG